jgi:hypothetical protein
MRTKRAQRVCKIQKEKRIILKSEKCPNPGVALVSGTQQTIKDIEQWFIPSTRI